MINCMFLYINQLKFYPNLRSSLLILIVTYPNSSFDHHFMDASEEDYPKFGNSETEVDYVVHQFYGFWQSFYTKKSFVWEEEWDTREAPNRWIRRKMEQENAKKTEQARKERSKEIQALVDWVRRRDPRVKELLKMAFLSIHET